jgi:hypothetical protein
MVCDGAIRRPPTSVVSNSWSSSCWPAGLVTTKRLSVPSGSRKSVKIQVPVCGSCATPPEVPRIPMVPAGVSIETPSPWAEPTLPVMKTKEPLMTVASRPLLLPAGS